MKISLIVYSLSDFFFCHFPFVFHFSKNSSQKGKQLKTKQLKTPFLFGYGYVLYALDYRFQNRA
jgi:hypothetical protein